MNARIGTRVAMILAMVAWVDPAPAQLTSRSAPSNNYFAEFGMFYDGDYSDALKAFQSESRGSIKNAQTRWIDSICYETMCGECYFQMGMLDKALPHYTAALQIYKTFPDWMMKVQFPPSIRVASAGARRAVPWGSSTRQAQLGSYRPMDLIGQGQIDMTDVVKSGGIVQQANLFSISSQEIVRMTCLALRRRTALLGPVSKFDPLTAEVLAAMNRSIGPPNHWTEAWTNLERGLALLASGKDTQAAGLLQRAVLAGGEFDHPMTCVALLELGRLAMRAGDYPKAATFFDEATFAAVNQYAASERSLPDCGTLEEAFRYRAAVHLLSGGKGFFTPLEQAIQWAKAKNLRQLRASLLLCAAENYIVLNQPHQAELMLKEAVATIGRRKMGAGAIGGRLSYLTAVVAFQQKRISEGNAALASAMEYMRHGSFWLFHIDLTDGLYVSGGATPRMAMDLFAAVLREPQPSDWATEPMESLATLTTPQPIAFEHWLETALAQKVDVTAIEIADRIRRRRFFNSLELGGRLESLRWLLEGPAVYLPQQAQLQRQDLLARYPAYAKLSQQAKAIHATMAKKPLVAEDPAALKEQTRGLAELADLGVKQEAILREIAVRREPAAMVFPPLQTVPEVQKSLPSKHAVMGFFFAGRRLYGFLLNNERCMLWQVGAWPGLVKQIQNMLREMGNFDQKHELTIKDLGDSKWKQSGKQVLDALLKGSPADFTQPFDELAIVPDGVLWYLPFEALQVSADGRLQPLIARFRVRYAPMLSLAVLQGGGRSPTDNTAVVQGRLASRDEEAAARKAFDQFAAVVPGAMALRPPSPAPAAAYSTLFRRLVVFDDIPFSEQDLYGWSPAPIERGRMGGTLADWLLLPWGGPDVAVFPGFHTTAEDGLKRVNKNQAGNDVFLAVCGLMANGARTVLLSRWRTGGQTSTDLVREFMQELPNSSPADAWQRAVLLTVGSRLNLDAEPRLKKSSTDETPKANHPLFWAGYMLVDCGTGLEQAAPKAAEPPIQPKKPAAVEEDKARVPEKLLIEEPKAREKEPEKPTPDEPKTKTPEKPPVGESKVKPKAKRPAKTDPN
jgi:tetratricopeptide (TPR) repeat protein